jgi:hypothetical protein
MRIIVRADDGDQITVNADDIATEQRIIRLELHNLAFNAVEDFELVTMTVERARELACALLTIAEAVDDIEGAGRPTVTDRHSQFAASQNNDNAPLN